MTRKTITYRQAGRNMPRRAACTATPTNAWTKQENTRASASSQRPLTSAEKQTSFIKEAWTEPEKATTPGSSFFQYDGQHCLSSTVRKKLVVESCKIHWTN